MRFLIISQRGGGEKRWNVHSIQDTRLDADHLLIVRRAIGYGKQVNIILKLRLRKPYIKDYCL
ncbi:hypothetical protein LCGC14_2203110 [marine sediment metagenome]|uniref:Uncharacterized protein n=1 Tax=marine sediment metagenome TaxID=412755 RepID=A0A0F9GBU4_9ZZZZ